MNTLIALDQHFADLGAALSEWWTKHTRYGKRILVQILGNLATLLFLGSGVMRLLWKPDYSYAFAVIMALMVFLVYGLPNPQASFEVSVNNVSITHLVFSLCWWIAGFANIVTLLLDTLSLFVGVDTFGPAYLDQLFWTAGWILMIAAMYVVRKPPTGPRKQKRKKKIRSWIPSWSINPQTAPMGA